MGIGELVGPSGMVKEELSLSLVGCQGESWPLLELGTGRDQG